VLESRSQSISLPHLNHAIRISTKAINTESTQLLTEAKLYQQQLTVIKCKKCYLK